MTKSHDELKKILEDISELSRETQNTIKKQSKHLDKRDSGLAAAEPVLEKISQQSKNPAITLREAEYLMAGVLIAKSHVESIAKAARENKLQKELPVIYDMFINALQTWEDSYARALAKIKITTASGHKKSSPQPAHQPNQLSIAQKIGEAHRPPQPRRGGLDILQKHLEGNKSYDSYSERHAQGRTKRK